MFKELIIKLSRPRLIGLYLQQRLSKSIFFSLLLCLVAIIPYIIRLSFDKQLTTESYDIIADSLMSSGYDFELKVENGVLTGEKDIKLEGVYSYILITPTNTSYNITTSNMFTPILVYGSNTIELRLGGGTLIKSTYEEAGIANLDFNKIMNNDYLEMDKLYYSMNHIYQKMHLTRIIADSITAYIQCLIIVFATALILSILATLIKRGLPFVLRYKFALDCQVITLFMLFVGFLFNADWLYIIGTVLSFIYLILLLSTIVRVKQPKKEDEI